MDALTQVVTQDRIPWIFWPLAFIAIFGVALLLCWYLKLIWAASMTDVKGSEAYGDWPHVDEARDDR